MDGARITEAPQARFDGAGVPNRNPRVTGASPMVYSGATDFGRHDP